MFRASVSQQSPAPDANTQRSTKPIPACWGISLTFSPDPLCPQDAPGSHLAGKRYLDEEYLYVCGSYCCGEYRRIVVADFMIFCIVAVRFVLK